MNCTVTQGGLINSGSGWLPRNASGGVSLPSAPPITFSYLLEQSQNCGGSNPNQQTGSLSCQFTLTQTTTVQISVSGRVEEEQANFDFFTIKIGSTQAQISSLGNSLGCFFSQRSDSASVTLSPGTYTYNATVDTVDYNYHEGTAITFSITGTNPLP